MADDYHRGEMDIHEQVATYHAVMGMTKWGCLALAVAILALVMWFCTPVGFIGGAIPALVLLVLGIVFLREKKGGGH
ncbi:MAG: cytochrome oxidase subunit [Caulobacter sp.]|nr:cytochrome oxidase subunit [Caulobacter sp.]